MSDIIVFRGKDTEKIGTHDTIPPNFPFIWFHLVLFCFFAIMFVRILILFNFAQIITTRNRVLSLLFKIHIPMKNILLTILFSCIAALAIAQSNPYIIQTGPLTSAELQRLNNQRFENPPVQETQVDWDWSAPEVDNETLMERNPAYRQFMERYNRMKQQPGFNPDFVMNTQGVGTAYVPEIDELGFKKGRVFSGNEMQHLREIRAEEQKALLKKTIGIALGALAILFVTIAIVKRKN